MSQDEGSIQPDLAPSNSGDDDPFASQVDDLQSKVEEATNRAAANEQQIQSLFSLINSLASRVLEPNTTTDLELSQIRDELAAQMKMLLEVYPARTQPTSEAATATSRTQVLITGSSRIGSADAWTYTGKVLELVDGGSREFAYTTVGDPVTLYNRAEFAAIGGAAVGALEAAYHQLGLKNSSIVGSCKVLPFRGGYIADCDEIDSKYYFTAENTIGPE